MKSDSGFLPISQTAVLTVDQGWKGERRIHRIVKVSKGFGTRHVARAAVSKIVRPTVRRWRPMVGIHKLQPRPSNLSEILFGGLAGRREQNFPRLTRPRRVKLSLGVSIKIFRGKRRMESHPSSGTGNLSTGSFDERIIQRSINRKKKLRREIVSV